MTLGAGTHLAWGEPASQRPGQPPPLPPDPSLRQLLERQAARLGTRPFLSLGDGTLSFAELDELANRMAWVLLSQGVRRGDVVMARCANNSTMVATWLGCAKADLIFMPLNSLLTGEALRAVLSLASAALVVCDAAGYPALAACGGELPPVLVGGGGLDALVEQAPSGPPPALASDPGAPSKLMCTSGTTGTPKAVLWSRACEANWAAAYGDELLPISEGEGLYCCLPLFHVTCQGTLLAALRRGGRMTVDERFDPFGFWSRVRRSEAVAFSFVGTLLSVLDKRPRQPDDADNQVRWVLGSAAPVGAWRSLEERFGLSIIETWGQTETASCWTAPRSLPQAPGTVGRPSVRFEARVVGPDGVELGEGEAGELWIRPLRPHVMFAGYLAQGGGAPSREGWTEDGFYRTGDLMARLPGGDLAFAGRLRESIRRRGEVIPSGVIESVALAHEAVLEAAAVGVADDDGVEQEVMLCAVLQPGSPLGPADLHTFMRQRLPKFMVPRYVALRDDLPKTPSTRVRKVALSEAGSATAWDSRHPDRFE